MSAADLLIAQLKQKIVASNDVGDKTAFSDALEQIRRDQARIAALESQIAELGTAPAGNANPPVGYFIEVDPGRWEQAADPEKNAQWFADMELPTDDLVQLYRHPPAAIAPAGTAPAGTLVLDDDTGGDPPGWDADCHKCLSGRMPPRMILCPRCGNKRCPKASDHDLACTGSNMSGQPGSIYP